MTQLTTQRFCALLRNGMEFWMNSQEAKLVAKFLMDDNSPKFFNVRGSPVNKYEFIGLFTAQQIEDMKHKKLNDWQCEELKWHSKVDPCDCWQYEI